MRPSISSASSARKLELCPPPTLSVRLLQPASAWKFSLARLAAAASALISRGRLVAPALPRRPINLALPADSDEPSRVGSKRLPVRWSRLRRELAECSHRRRRPIQTTSATLPIAAPPPHLIIHFYCIRGGGGGGAIVNSSYGLGEGASLRAAAEALHRARSRRGRRSNLELPHGRLECAERSSSRAKSCTRTRSSPMTRSLAMGETRPQQLANNENDHDSEPRSRRRRDATCCASLARRWPLLFPARPPDSLTRWLSWADGSTQQQRQHNATTSRRGCKSCCIVQAPAVRLQRRDPVAPARETKPPLTRVTSVPERRSQRSMQMPAAWSRARAAVGAVAAHNFSPETENVVL